MLLFRQMKIRRAARPPFSIVIIHKSNCLLILISLKVGDIFEVLAKDATTTSSSDNCIHIRSFLGNFQNSIYLGKKSPFRNLRSSELAAPIPSAIIRPVDSYTVTLTS